MAGPRDPEDFTSLALSATPGYRQGFPASDDPDFPRRLGTAHADWPAAIAKYDPRAGVLPAMFPRFWWEQDSRAARSYYKGRRKNHITDRHLTLLSNFFSAVRSDDDPEWWPCSPQSLHQKFFDVVPILESRVANELDGLEERIAEFLDGDAEYAVAEFSRAREVVNTGVVANIKATFLSGLHAGLKWPILMALALRGEKIAMAETVRGEVLAELAEDEAALEIFKNLKIDHAALFGFSPEQVEGERRRLQDALLAKRNLMRAALGLNDPDAASSFHFSPPPDAHLSDVPVPTHATQTHTAQNADNQP